jgi:hypothetical protein
MEKAFPGLNSNVTVDGSKSIALSFFDENQNEKLVQNSDKPFIFSIPRDTSQPLPPFIYLLNNSSNTSIKSFSNLLALDGFMLNKQNVSIHYQISPNDNKIGYFFALKFGGNPYLNSDLQVFDMWSIFCPKGMKYFDFFSIYLLLINLEIFIKQ